MLSCCDVETHTSLLCSCFMILRVNLFFHLLYVVG